MYERKACSVKFDRYMREIVMLHSDQVVYV
jgi:hypothetical protein